MSGTPTVLVAAEQLEAWEPLARALRRRGYTVALARDGFEAENYLAGEVPALTIVEMLLPKGSGFQITRLVKERSDGKAAVLMLAGNAADAHRDYALVLGVDRLLARPFTPRSLLDAVVSLCPVPRRAARSRRPARVPAS